MSFQVTLNYLGTAQTVLAKSFNNYYKAACAKIKNSRFTSYKGAGISTAETKDNRGKTWTAVTCTIIALLDMATGLVYMRMVHGWSTDNA